MFKILIFGVYFKFHDLVLYVGVTLHEILLKKRLQEHFITAKHVSLRSWFDLPSWAEDAGRILVKYLPFQAPLVLWSSLLKKPQQLAVFARLVPWLHGLEYLSLITQWLLKHPNPWQMLHTYVLVDCLNICSNKEGENTDPSRQHVSQHAYWLS